MAAEETRLDIKDFILISGGLLISLVIGHGFWIAWRAKREPFRLDIVPDLIPDDVDDMERLRGELPNGGARVVNQREDDMAHASLALDVPPILMDVDDDGLDIPPTVNGEQHRQKSPEPRQPIRRAPHYRETDTESIVASDELPAPVTVKEVSMPIIAETPVRIKSDERERAPRFRRANAERKASPEAPADTSIQELLVLNVLAPRHAPFAGDGLVNALRAQGLRYGDMNIFHRVVPATKAKIFSVANAVEPGTFDLADIEHLSSPGMTFFLQLPGPDDALAAFDMMLDAARNIALDLGGDVKDEQLSALTGQTAEHMRQRIADFARRRLSKRA